MVIVFQVSQYVERANNWFAYNSDQSLHKSIIKSTLNVREMRLPETLFCDIPSYDPHNSDACLPKNLAEQRTVDWHACFSNAQGLTNTMDSNLRKCP